ncbi:endonuclease/exonuclease/phosphatase family protein [Cellulomonas sp. GbtcB1]|uniref:endonuclease/exonuclease/phosphatase family protein n=1 Tax=Cellulomonas sp. GbtcB1 TaxID=2824746 RepID=UPI0027DF1EB2|nr:endonuclease/exonuclease/phosphatase family protein [Cellulomonas sp. GbtcB1]
MSVPEAAPPSVPAASAPSPAGSPLPPDAGTATRVSLVALVTVLALDAVRAAGPVLDRAFAVSTVAVAGAAVVTFLGAGLLAALALVGTGRRGPGTASGRTALVAVVALGAARLVTQVVHDEARFVAGLVTASLAVAALVLATTLVAGRAGGGRQAALGLTLGTGLSAGLQLALGTWDPLWRGGVLGSVVAVVLVLLAVALAWVARRETATGRPRRTWVLGPALALVVMVLGNPAFAAAQSHLPLMAAGTATVLASALTAWLLLVPRIMARPVRWAAAVLLPVATAVAFLTTGVPALVAILVAEAAAGVVLTVALKTRRPAPPGIPRTALATGGVGLGLVVVLLLYLLDYDVPLGVDNAWVVVLAAALLATGGLRWRTPPEPAEAAAPTTVEAGAREPAPPLRANALRFLVLPSVALLLVGWVSATLAAPAPAADADPDTFVVLDWNLHYGVAAHTAVDLEQIARTIEAQGPDVVALQEVSRGWVLGGGADMLTWLGHRLGMHVAFAPAADQQFGNALLSRTELTDVEVVDLPYGAGPQERSALTARVAGPGGESVRVTSVHLQHRDDNVDTRLDQLAALEDALPDDVPSVLAGDLNAEPGSAELDALGGAGWVSAMDTAGAEDVLTHPSNEPAVRIDWVLGRGGVTFAEARVLADDSSDHLALVTEVRAG